jgi:hypothetical protein
MLLPILAPLVTDSFAAESPEEQIDDTIQVIASTFRAIIIVYIVGVVVSILLAIWAMYLSFVRNNGFEIVAFFVALCCSPCYIAYAYAVPVTSPS